MLGICVASPAIVKPVPRGRSRNSGTFVVIFFVRRRSSFDRRLKGGLLANLL
jgi:hypothetical protein